MINTNMNTAVSFGKAQKNQKSEKNHHPRTQGDSIKRIAVNTAITAGTGAAVGAVGIGQLCKAYAAMATIAVKNNLKELKAMRLLEGTIGKNEARITSIKNTISAIKTQRNNTLSYIKDGVTAQMRGSAAVRFAIAAVVVGTTGSLVVHGLKDMFRTDKHK